jgi:hypothetical protein
MEQNTNQNQNPLRKAEDEIELELDRGIELEQSPIMGRGKLPIWATALIVIVIIAALFWILSKLGII